MTVSSISPVNNYTGNGSSTIFDFDFLIEHPEELVVTHISTSGVKNNLTLGVDYSINEIGNKNGSYIIFPLENSSYSILQSNEVLSLTLNLEIKQESEFENSSYLNLKVLEWTFDYIVRIIQMLSRKLDRAIKVNEGININPDTVIENMNEAQKKAELSAKKAEEFESQSKEYLKEIKKYSDDTDLACDNAQNALQQANLIVKNLEETFNNNHISNCILRMPKRIKYEIQSDYGQIRLKKGSEVFLPKADGSIESIVLDSDTPWNSDLWAYDTNFNRLVLLFYCPELKCLKACVSNECVFHQETIPNKSQIPFYGVSLWDNGKELKLTFDSGLTWYNVTLPIMYGTPIWVNTDQNKNTLFKDNKAYAGWKKTIAEVFNGFGFFGRKILISFF